MQEALVKSRIARVEIWTDRYRLVGNIHIPVTGYKARLSDVLNEEKRPFLALTDVSLYTLNGGEPLWRGGFLALNKASVILVKAIAE